MLYDVGPLKDQVTQKFVMFSRIFKRTKNTAKGIHLDNHYLYKSACNKYVYTYIYIYKYVT